MAHFLCMAWSSDPHFRVRHYAGIPLAIHHNSDEVDQIVVPKSDGFHELLIKELHVKPLASYLGVCKLTHALFQRVWWPKLHNSDFLCPFMHDLCTKKKHYSSSTWFTAAPSSPQISLLYMEHWFYHWFMTLSWVYTILTCVDYLTKYTILIPCKMGN